MHSMTRNLFEKLRNYFPLLFIGVIFVAGFLWYARGTPASAEQLAQEIVATCDDSTDRPACYEAQVPTLYPQKSVSEVFDVIRSIRREDRSYQFCHVLAHKIGERVVAEDPSKWIEAISLNPVDGLCSNGFVHGVTGERFRSEVLSPETIESTIADFTRACAPRPNWTPSDLDRSICYHGMGHLYDFITNADIPEALKLCSRTTPPSDERTCIEGVFMQIYQPLEPDDFELIKQMKVKPTKETVRQYCAQYKDPEYVGACLRESWPFFDEGVRDGTAVAAFCSGQPDATRTENCYQAMSSIVGRMSLDSADKAATACGHFPQEWQAMCFSYSAEAVLQESRTESAAAVALCEKASGSAQSACFAHLLNHARFIFGQNKSQFKNFCAALPPSLTDECMRYYENQAATP